MNFKNINIIHINNFKYEVIQADNEIKKLIEEIN